MSDVPAQLDLAATGDELYRLVERLYPICRSITGSGVSQSLDILQSYIPLTRHTLRSGTQVFDWTIPDEWNLRRAVLRDPAGGVVVDSDQHNLHVLNYSVALRRKVDFAELRPHLFSIPDHPDWVPYRTSYYKPNWGFCLPDRQLQTLQPGAYDVDIDATLTPGVMTWGELFLPGESADEMLISAHICHPSLANDNCSGLAVSTLLAMHLGSRRRKISYRFVFAPGTIGAIAWLAQNESHLHRLRAGLVISCVGDNGPMTYKRSRRGNAEIDQVVERVLSTSSKPHRIVDFIPFGYDERQYCSPGFNLPVGCLTRTPNGQYPEYHSSADNLSLMSRDGLADSLATYLRVCELLESGQFQGKASRALPNDARRSDQQIASDKTQDASPCYINTLPRCEPQLGKRGLYQATGGLADPGAAQLAMLWLLNYSDGQHSLQDISRRSGIDLTLLMQTVDLLKRHQLLVDL